MGNILKMSFILFAVAAFASGLLAYFNGFTKPQIEALKLANEKESRLYVMPAAKNFEEVAFTDIKDEKFYKALDENNQLLGYVFIAKGPGYSGIVETMVGMDTDFKILNIKVIKQTETPGLGAESQTIKFGENNPYFENWFKEKNAMKVVVVKDDQSSEDKVQSLTGATITTRSVCKAINHYALAVKAIIGDSEPQIISNCAADSSGVLKCAMDSNKQCDQQQGGK